MLINCIALDAGSARVVYIIGTKEIIITGWRNSPPNLGVKRTRISYGKYTHWKCSNNPPCRQDRKFIVEISDF